MIFCPMAILKLMYVPRDCTSISTCMSVNIHCYCCEDLCIQLKVRNKLFFFFNAQYAGIVMNRLKKGATKSKG